MRFEDMRSAWIQAGFVPEDFWRATPRTYILDMEAYAAREARDMKKQKSLAWLNAVLPLQKRVPKLHEILGERRKLNHEEVVGHLKSMTHKMPKRKLREWLSTPSSAPSA